MNTNVTDLNQALLSLLECPTCKKFMIPPIRQCSGGHNLCSICITSSTNCPTCKKSFSKARNYALEEIARKLDFPCEFRDKGCMATFKIENLEHHQSNCLYNVHRCRVGACKIWSSQLATLVDHVKNEHADSFLTGSTKEMKISKWVSNANHWFVYLLSALDKHFWLHYRLMGGQNKVMVAIQNMDTDSFRYEVLMGSADSTLITYSATVHSEEQDMNEVFMKENCFCISTRTAKNFTESDKALKFQVSVKHA